MKESIDLKEQYALLDEAWARNSYFDDACYQIGEHPVRLLFGSPGLAKQLARCFSHLRILDGLQPDFTIRVWETATSKSSLPPLDWIKLCSNGYQGCTEGSLYFHFFGEIRALSAIDLSQKTAHFVFHDRVYLPWWVAGSFLQIVLHLWLRSHSIQLTHCAAVGKKDRAILLTGRGGSGKSSTTALCVAKGLSYLGEDYCALSAKDKPTVYSIYQSAKWTSFTTQMFPFSKEFIANPVAAKTGKALLYYDDLFPRQILTSAPIRSIVSLKVSKNRYPSLEKIDYFSCMKNLTMSTLKQLPFYNKKTLDILSDFAKKTAHYELFLGYEMDANFQYIEELLEQS